MRHFFITLLLLISLFTFGQSVPRVMKLHPQHHFPHSVPKGNYSGIAYIGSNQYAVVSDKAEKSGYFLFTIDIDSLKGDIQNVVANGFYPSTDSNQDEEGIAFIPQRNTFFIAREADNSVKEYDRNGQLTGVELALPSLFKSATAAYGLESLTYNPHTKLYWTTTESTLPADGMQATATNNVCNKLRLLAFDSSLASIAEFLYVMDKPRTRKEGQSFAMGVADLVALDSGKLLVLERELYVSKSKLGSRVYNKLYCVTPTFSAETAHNTPLEKHLLTEWSTAITLLHQDFANYEGICLGPKLCDGSQVLLLCADSQNQYGGVLRDWFRTIIIKE